MVTAAAAAYAADSFFRQYVHTRVWVPDIVIDQTDRERKGEKAVTTAAVIVAGTYCTSVFITQTYSDQTQLSMQLL